MSGPEWILILVAATLLSGGFLVWRPARSAWHRPRLLEARRAFHWQRERLEAKFFDLARQRAEIGRSCWLDCDFDDEVAYVRNRTTGELSAFVGVAITMAAPGPAPGHLDAPAPFGEPGPRDTAAHSIRSGVRLATAVFRFAGDRWVTDGRAIFNLSPAETIRFYRRDLEIVAHESAGRQWTA